MSKNWKKSNKFLGVLLGILATIGLVASLTLTHEVIATLKDPTYDPTCNISPWLSCESVMSRSEAEVLGLPFSVFGVAGFGALLAFAVLVYDGTKFRAWVWKAAVAVAGLAILFTLHLYILSLFSFNTMCPWCFVTWLTAIAIFWSLVTYVLASSVVKLPKKMRKLGVFWTKNAVMILAAWYVLLVFSVVLRFQEAILG